MQDERTIFLKNWGWDFKILVNELFECVWPFCQNGHLKG